MQHLLFSLCSFTEFQSCASRKASGMCSGLKSLFVFAWAASSMSQLALGGHSLPVASWSLIYVCTEYSTCTKVGCVTLPQSAFRSSRALIGAL